MEKSEVVALAKIASKKAQTLASYASLNVYGKTAEERVDIDARYMIAQSEFFAAQRAYDAAMQRYLTQPAALTTEDSGLTGLA